MNNSDFDSNQIRRYQISSAATDSTLFITVLDTITGEVWVRSHFEGLGGSKQLLKQENQGKKIWEIPIK
jgi:hypothetical protein